MNEIKGMAVKTKGGYTHVAVDVVENNVECLCGKILKFELPDVKSLNVPILHMDGKSRVTCRGCKRRAKELLSLYELVVEGDEIEMPLWELPRKESN